MDSSSAGKEFQTVTWHQVHIQLRPDRGALPGGALGSQPVGIPEEYGVENTGSQSIRPTRRIPLQQPRPQPSDVSQGWSGRTQGCESMPNGGKFLLVPWPLGVIEKTTWEKLHGCSLNGESYRQVRLSFHSEQTSLMPWKALKGREGSHFPPSNTHPSLSCAVGECDHHLTKERGNP